MAKIAVDIVLLPDNKMSEKTIKANKILLKQCPNKIILDKEGCLPHISLAMGCIVESDIAKIDEILQTVAEKFPPGPLTAAGIHIGTNSVGEKVSVFEITRTETLQSLHEEVMLKLVPYFSYDVTTDMVFSPPTAGKSTLLWIKNYPEKSSYENFFPHITIGYGQINDFSLPAKFTAPEIALCHLGNHCTCRKILATADLKG